MSMPRRRFLGLLGLAPAVPMINRLPAVETPAVANAVRSIPLTDMSTFTANGGWCVPLSPTYELMNISMVNRPIHDAWKITPTPRGGVRYVGRS